MSDKKKIGADVDAQAAEEFSAWCEVNGLAKGKAVEAAFILLRVAPLHLRNLAMRRDSRSVQDWLLSADSLIAAEEVRQGAEQPLKHQHAERRSAAGKR